MQPANLPAGSVYGDRNKQMVFGQKSFKKPKQGRAWCSAEEETKGKVGCIMRKVLLVLTVLAMTAPCWAAVNVECATGGDIGYEVTISYDCAGDGNDIRAFGIQVDVNNGAIISDVNAVMNTNYYIYPGSIDINSAGGVESYGSAVVDLTSSSFILEMGSLYDPCDPVHKDPPPTSGTICTFNVNKACVVSLSRDTARGGVVMEDGSDYATLSGCTVFDCMPTGHADHSQWGTVGKPASWCYPSQCYGDADGQSEAVGRGFAKVYNNDVAILVAGYGIPDTEYIDPVTDPWIAADFDHAAQIVGRSSVRVYDDDVAILVNYYSLTSGVPTDCNDVP